METPTIPASTRPSQVIAEALLEGHDQRQIADRAERLGLSPHLTTAIIAACCGSSSASNDTGKSVTTSSV